MQVEEFQTLLSQHQNLPLVLRLPDGSLVPQHFHITEVGRVQKDFIDCGGMMRSTAACVMQVWVAHDTAHRLNAGKLAKIIDLAAPLPIQSLPVEIEYETSALSQYRVVGATTTSSSLQIQLEGKKAACLAVDRCILPMAESCCSGDQCCN